MSNERYSVMPATCTHCGEKFTVCVASRAGAAQMADQLVLCSNCEKHFEVMLPDRIISGPYAAA
jgi:hydrogenase maturation factor HypF (carbamoyltransferase family)